MVVRQYGSGLLGCLEQLLGNVSSTAEQSNDPAQPPHAPVVGVQLDVQKEWCMLL